jgi:hypothetical protein
LTLSASIIAHCKFARSLRAVERLLDGLPLGVQYLRLGRRR